MSNQSRKSLTQKIGLFSGVAVFSLILLFFDFDPGKPEATKMAAVAALMAIWWVTEAIPLFVTALLPIALYPVLGILKGKLTAPIYMNSVIFLFLGGFMIAAAMKRHGFHRRLALTILKIFGGGQSRVVLGFMAASGFISMWISDTATAMMMLPIGLAIIAQMEEKFGKKNSRKFTISLMLGMSYSCLMGGMATFVGTPPNALFAQIFEITFPKAPPISFGQWMLAMLPISIIMILTLWLLLTKVFFRAPANLRIDSSIVKEEYRKLGPMTFEEKAVMAVFVSTALLWIFRKELDLGAFSIPGWSRLIPYPDLIDDGTVAVFMAMIMFFIPTKNTEKGYTIIDTEVFKTLPWNILFLFGGGFALARGFQITGFSSLIGAQFSGLAGMHPFLMVVIICISISFLSEFTSNTATIQLVLPILASISVAARINPMFLMIPAALAASCVFTMPVSSPPNTIAFGSGKFKIWEMARVGFILDLIAMIVVSTLFYFWGTTVFNIDPAVLPDWAR